MTLLSKPDVSKVWASGGAIVEPSDTKKATGWLPEVPPHQWENWIQNRQDQFIAHVNQRGIAAWDGLTEYEAGSLSYVQGTDGKIYKSVAASGPSTVVQNPVTDAADTYWSIAFADVGAFITQSEGDTRYTQKSNNLSDVLNTATALSNLGGSPLASPVFTGIPSVPTATIGTNTTQAASTAFVIAQDTRSLNSTRIDVASSSTVSLTASAPNTAHINITGTTTINGFTVAIGKAYLVRFAGILTLTNGASLVTQSGANITTAAGDTCWIRATAANVVEVLCYTPGIRQEKGYGQEWQDVTGSRVAVTIYANNTGRAIEVCIVGSGTARDVEVSVDSVTWVPMVLLGGSGDGEGGGFTVPNAHYYRVNGSTSLIRWVELR